jgi:hypothetical protein
MKQQTESKIFNQHWWDFYIKADRPMVIAKLVKLTKMKSKDLRVLPDDKLNKLAVSHGLIENKRPKHNPYG